MLDVSNNWTIVTFFLIFLGDLEMFYTNYLTSQFKYTCRFVSVKLLNLLNLRNKNVEYFNIYSSKARVQQTQFLWISWTPCVINTKKPELESFHNYAIKS